MNRKGHTIYKLPESVLRPTDKGKLTSQDIGNNLIEFSLKKPPGSKIPLPLTDFDLARATKIIKKYFKGRDQRFKPHMFPNESCGSTSKFLEPWKLSQAELEYLSGLKVNVFWELVDELEKAGLNSMTSLGSVPAMLLLCR